MKRAIFAFAAGGLFGLGLLVSGMTDTSKVRGWLDFFGNWDPTLAFVMGGAIIPMFIAWRITEARKPVLGGDFPQKPDFELDRELVIGSVMFGMGWGLSGLCPGPAIASLSYGGTPHLIFFAAMVVGMFAMPFIRKRLDSSVAQG